MATKVGDLFAELTLKAKDAIRDLDKFVAGLEEATKDAEAAEDATEDLGAELDKTGKKARGMGENITRSMREARKELQSLGNGARRIGQAVGSGLQTIATAAAAATVAAGGFVALWSAGTEEIARDAKKLGIPVEEFEELNAAFKLAGAESDSTREAFKTFQEGMGDLINEGAGPLKDAFDRVGLTLNDVQGKPIGDQMGIVFDAINRLPTAAERTGATMLAFADDGFRMGQLIAEGSEGLKLAREEAVKLGAVTSGSARKAAVEFQKTWREALIVFNDVGNTLGEVLAPIFTKVIKQVQDWTRENKELIGVKLVEFLEKLSQLAGDLIPIFLKVVKFGGDVIDSFGGIENAIKDITIAWAGMSIALATGNPIIIAATAAGLALAKLLGDVERAEAKAQKKEFELGRGVQLSDEQRAALAGGTGRRGAENRAFAANAARATQAFREATGDLQRAQSQRHQGPSRGRPIRARARAVKEAQARLAAARAASESANATLQAVLGDLGARGAGSLTAGEATAAGDASAASIAARAELAKTSTGRAKSFVAKGAAERPEAERLKREGGKKKSLAELIAGATGQGLSGAIGSLAPKGPGTTINNFTVNNNVGATTVSIEIDGLLEGGATQVANTVNEKLADVIDTRVREAFEANNRQVVG